jgi:membrane protease subunit HflC
MNRIVALVAVVVVLLLVASSTVFVVDPSHVAVVSGTGGGKPTLAQSGLHVKLPPPLQTATLIDTRTQSFEASEADRFTTSDKTELLVNPIVRFRVADALKLFAATSGDPQTLSDRLASLSRDALGTAFGQFTLADVLSQQQKLTDAARDSLKEAAAPLGIDVLDVSLARVDYSSEQAESVFKRMSAAREQAAADERAQGAAEAQEIRDDATHKKDALLADAYSKAQAIKGDGDGKAAAIAAAAFGRDPQFYQFYQSLLAYRSSFHPGDVIVVDSSSDFFRFMRNPYGDAPPASANAPHRANNR